MWARIGSALKNNLIFYAVLTVSTYPSCSSQSVGWKKDDLQTGMGAQSSWSVQCTKPDSFAVCRLWAL